MSPAVKKRRICRCQHISSSYKPAGLPMKNLEKIILQRDELETLKLCDKDGLTQEEAGAKMGISRGTVQRILSEARRKVATALTECCALIMEQNICRKKENTE